MRTRGPGQVVGRVFADDEDNDSLTYKLVAADSPAEEEFKKFTINKTTGEIRTKAGETYNYETIADDNTCGELTVYNRSAATGATRSR